MNKLYTKTEFEEKYKNHTFVKLTNKKEIHNGFQFKTGLNIDTNEFNPYGECSKGGIYFTDINTLVLWLDYNEEPMVNIRYVDFPEDVKIYEEKDKFKADKIVLSERYLIENIKEWNNKEFIINSLKQNRNALEYVKEQTEEIC